MKRLALFLSLSVPALGCASTDTDTSSEAFAVQTPDHGVTFENQSALLAPFSRAAAGEGLGGVAWLDYDQDGDLDLYLTNGVGAANGLFRNNGDGSFTDVTFAAGVAGFYGNSGVVVGDIDNDSLPDIFLTGEGRLAGPAQTPTRLFHNQGDGTFDEIAGAAGVVGAGSALAPAMGDINGDGYLDIFIASPGHISVLTGPGTEESHENKLYLNNGDLTFTDITDAAGVDGLYALEDGRIVSEGACVAGFTDYDQDGDPDILVGNCNAYPFEPAPMPVRATPFSLYRNNGDLTFSDVTVAAGLDIDGFWMGLALGDIDNDGDVDFFATSTGTFTGHLHALMRNNGNGTFTDIGLEAGVAAAEFGWGTNMADFDNDGDLDLYQLGSLPLFGAIGAAGSPGRMYFNDGTGHFVEDPAATGVNLSFDYTTGSAQGDYDGDGFADLVVMVSPWAAGDFANPNGAPVLLRNQGNTNNAVTLQLVGTASNWSAVGARVEVRTGDDNQVREVRAGSSMASSESPWVSVGIGQRSSADLRITWPSGLVEELDDIFAGSVVTIVEGTGNADGGGN